MRKSFIFTHLFQAEVRLGSLSFEATTGIYALLTLYEASVCREGRGGEGGGAILHT